ncbi:MAG: TolC family protein [Acidobacteria bacterium]|nr:TolC family protein [Acidobacteriota bacterium]
MKHALLRQTAVLSLIAAGGLAGPSPVSAQGPAAAGTPPTTIHLTLPQTIDLALQTSHRVGEIEARQEAATAAVASRSAADMPFISLLAGYTRTNHVEEFGIPAAPGSPPKIIYPDVPDNWRSRVDMQWPICTFGRVASLERAAKAEQAAAGKDVSTVKADMRLEAARAFWALITANEAVRVVDEAMKLVDAHLRDVNNMRDVGLVAPNDVLSVEAQRSREQVLLIEARNARDVAEADLRRVTGLPAETAVVLEATIDGPIADAPTFDQLFAEAQANRSERQALENRATGLGERRAAVAAGLHPIITLGAGFDYAKPNPRIFPREDAWKDSWDVGVNVAWPLWDGGRVKADVAEVSANRRAIEQRLAEFDSYLAFDVRQRRLDLEAARASIAAATDEVAAATEARRVVSERFKAGLVTNTEVLDAQQAMLFAQLDRTRALAAARLSQARLDRVVGR